MSEQAGNQQQQVDVRKRLENLQASVMDRKKRVDSDLNRESGPIPADFSEQAAAVENDEALVAIQAELERQLGQIEQALQRLESGDYGCCERCHQEIRSERLRAIPTAALCIDCASIASD